MVTEQDAPTAEELRATYGKPEMVDAARFLSLLGPAVAVNGAVFAFRYLTVEAAEAFAEGNLRHHGWASLGPVTTEDGVFGAVVLSGPCCPEHGSSCPADVPLWRDLDQADDRGAFDH